MGAAQTPKRQEPLRQSYPLTDDVRRECSMSEDVAEKTRQQLAAMGIQLEKLNPAEKSRWVYGSRSAVKQYEELGKCLK